RIAIAVHGGAGVLSAAELGARQPGIVSAADAGWRVLETGGSALDAVVAAVVALEDDPLFNAGLGSVLTEEGVVEMDASVMEGENLRAGAGAPGRGVAQPGLAACAVVGVVAKRVRGGGGVRGEGREVLLVGEPVAALARRRGLRVLRPDDLATADARRRWRERRQAPGETVGAVARDERGRLAAATS